MVIKVKKVQYLYQSLYYDAFGVFWWRWAPILNCPTED